MQADKAECRASESWKVQQCPDDAFAERYRRLNYRRGVTSLYKMGPPSFFLTASQARRLAMHDEWMRCVGNFLLTQLDRKGFRLQRTLSVFVARKFTCHTYKT